MIDTLVNLVCPDCREKLNRLEETFYCKNCNSTFNIINNFPVLLPLNTQNTSLIKDYISHYRIDAELFDYFEKPESDITSEETRRLQQYVISLAPKHFNTILDIGSGNAWVAGHFLPRQKKVISCDLSVVNVSKAMIKYPDENHYGLVADGLNMPLEDSSMDTIIAIEVIEHIAEPALFISSMIRLLKPGGKLIISTPYQEKIPYSLCIHCNQPTPMHAHLHSFDEAKLTSLFPAKNISGIRIYKVLNKFLLYSRLIRILRFLPFSIFRLKDHFFNLIINKPSRFVVLFTKPPVKPHK